jgi:stringent starvation protein B
MKSNKPYLLRAFFDWILDNQCTPLLTLNARHPMVVVPAQYIENGEITLNISPEAISDLKITNTHVEFSASFSGMVNFISAPLRAVLSLYAHENGEGMFFDPDDEDDLEPWETEGGADVHIGNGDSAAAASGSMKKSKASHLKVIK